MTDFDEGNTTDLVDLRGNTRIISFADLRANHIEQIGGDVRIFDGAGNAMVLKNVLPGALDTADFIFA